MKTRTATTRTIANVGRSRNAKTVTVTVGELQVIQNQVGFAIAAIEQPGQLGTAKDPTFTLRQALARLDVLKTDGSRW